MKIEKQEFYYQFNRLNVWLIFNIVLFNILAYWLVICPCLICWWQTQVLMGVCVVSWAFWCYKYVKKHRMALIDDKSIKIDTCEPLMWKDIKSAEEKNIRCWFKNYRILVLTPKENIQYNYNWLQKHNCNFTAFSIPLYGILRKEDEETLVKFVKAKVKKYTAL